MTSEEQPQVIEQGDVADNTQEQLEHLQRLEELAAREADWDRYKVVLTGDETEWAPRAGVNHATEDNREYNGVTYDIDAPMPWVAVARCEVILKAPSEDWARMHALRHNPEYHTVASVENLTEAEAE